MKAGTPRIAIRLYSGTFKDDKADTLRVLRHEMLHARHHEQAIDSLKGGRAAPKTEVDKALVARSSRTAPRTPSCSPTSRGS